MQHEQEQEQEQQKHAQEPAALAARRLAKTAVAGAREFFESIGHRPNGEMYAAMEDGALAMARCTTGEAERAVYLSSLDPGVGKTTLSIEFIRALLRDRTMQSVAVLVCVADYVESIPDDLMPIVVFDASGRERDTYRQWEERRGSLRRLKAAPKTYRNLTIRQLRRGGGKDSFRRNGPSLARTIASTIDQIPGEVLLAQHLPKSVDFDTDAAVKEQMKTATEGVKCITWGKHDATNEFAHIRTVVLAGFLFYPASHREALGRLCSRMPSAEGAYPERDTQAIAAGETRSLILQALCRSAVRYCEDGDCGACTAYIIAAPHHGLDDELPRLFPGCRVEDWAESAKPLRGKRLKAQQYVLSRLPALGCGTIPFSEIQDAIAMKDSANFSSRLRRDPSFASAMRALGLETVFEGKQPKGYKRSLSACESKMAA